MEGSGLQESLRHTHKFHDLRNPGTSGQNGLGKLWDEGHGQAGKQACPVHAPARPSLSFPPCPVSGTGVFRVCGGCRSGCGLALHWSHHTRTEREIPQLRLCCTPG